MKPVILLVLLAVVPFGCSSQHGAQVQTNSDYAARAISTADGPRLLAGQPSYASPEEAVQALYAASMVKDLPGIARIVGLPEEEVVTPDPTRNTERAAFFATAYDQYHSIVPEPGSDSYARVFIGHDNFPIASPLVRQGGKWFFDSAGGKEALITRYIGENELAVIGVCRAYVQAQYEYYAEDRNNDDVLEYAQHLGSAKGQHDGLYWRTADTEPESPLGPLVAKARASGFINGGAHNIDAPAPYHGYYFKILTRQGDSAPGGRHDYIINNHMIAGFALVAYPARYNKTGVMTFIVGPNGKVFQKNLGDSTPSIAEQMTDFDPDVTWTLVPD